MSEQIAPAVLEGRSLPKPNLHLFPESASQFQQLRRLQRLSELLQCGVSDPEMHYLGARYSLALGFDKTAEEFLDRLAKQFRYEGDVPAEVFAPIGILYLEVLPPSDKRKKVVRDLLTLAEKSQRLRAALERVGVEHEQRTLIAAPQYILDDLRENRLPLSVEFEALRVASIHTASDDENHVRRNGALDSKILQLQRLAHEASEAYDQRELERTRSCLEVMLRIDGNQVEVIRNLITVASELRLIEPYERYWRLFVRVLLRQLFCGRESMKAWQELIDFYCKVALSTDREFGDTSHKISEQIDRPGLLSRWLESHAALIWLDSALHVFPEHQRGDYSSRASSGRIAFMQKWFEIFFPEYAGFLELPTDSDSSRVFDGRFVKSHLPFDPAQRLLSRFGEWSKIQFGLDDDSGAHFETVCAMGEFVRNLPRHRYAKSLAESFGKDDPNAIPISRLMQESLSLPILIQLNKFRRNKKDEEDNHEGLIEFWNGLGGTDDLASLPRLIAAYSFCSTDRLPEGWDIIYSVLAILDTKEFEDDHEARILWKNSVHASCIALQNKSRTVRDHILSKWEERLLDLVADPIVIERCVDDFTEITEHIRLQDRIDDALKEAKHCIEQGQFPAARAAINALPSQPKEVRDLKRQFLGHITEAQEVHGINQLIEETMTQIQRALDRGDRIGAVNLVLGLPDHPQEVADLKRRLLIQLRF